MDFLATWDYSIPFSPNVKVTSFSFPRNEHLSFCTPHEMTLTMEDNQVLSHSIVLAGVFSFTGPLCLLGFSMQKISLKSFVIVYYKS